MTAGTQTGTLQDWQDLIDDNQRTIDRLKGEKKMRETQELNAILRDLELAALAIDEQFTQDKKTLQARNDLTAIGKEKHLAELNAARLAKVGELQQRARDLTGSRRSKAAKALGAAKVEEFEKLRATLGDQILSDVIRRKLAVRNVAEIKQLLDAATPGYEKLLIEQLSLVEIEGRVLGTESPTFENRVALTELRQATTPKAITEAEGAAKQIPGEDWVENLDVWGYKVNFADRIRGLVPETVPPPF